jgi:hypothetical protein
MVFKISLITLMIAGLALSSAAALPEIEWVTPGGRAEYDLCIDGDSPLFPWNLSTGSPSDRTRLMLDLTSQEWAFGAFYLKGEAVWDGEDRERSHRRLRFGQGDYRWRRETADDSLSLRLFANERRFFTHDLIAPLLDDDLVSSGDDNRGVRADAHLNHGITLSTVLSALGDDVVDSRGIAYLRTAYSHRMAELAFSYLYDDPAEDNLPGQAIFKTEVSAAYKKLAMFLSYQQSEFRDGGLFFPSGRFNFDRFVGDNFSSVLPDGGAVSAEARFKAIPLRQVGDVSLVTSYVAMGRAYVNNLGTDRNSVIGYTTSAFFFAKNVSLNARLVYHSSARAAFEREKRDGLEGSLWGMLRNGIEFFLRGGISRVDETAGLEDDHNFLHGAICHRTKKLESGVHVMLKDLDTVFSEKRFAWDGKLVLSPDIAVRWRLVLDRDFRGNDAVFARIEYRPSNRIFAHFSYGRSYLGDGPFLLEDRDLNLSRSGSAVYSISLRGDF